MRPKLLGIAWTEKKEAFQRPGRCGCHLVGTRASICLKYLPVFSYGINRRSGLEQALYARDG